MNSKFICEQIANLFEEPCNFSPCEEILHMEETDVKWCEKHCGRTTAAECWEHYFKIIQRKERENYDYKKHD